MFGEPRLREPLESAKGKAPAHGEREVRLGAHGMAKNRRSAQLARDLLDNDRHPGLQSYPAICRLK